MLFVPEMYGIEDTIRHDGQGFEDITRIICGVIWHGPEAAQDKS